MANSKLGIIKNLDYSRIELIFEDENFPSKNYFIRWYDIVLTWFMIYDIITHIIDFK